MRKTIRFTDFAAVLGLSATFVLSALLAFAFLIITLILAVLGFSGLGGTVSGVAKALLLAFPALFVISLILWWRGARNRGDWGGNVTNNFRKSKKSGGDINELGPDTR
jgi:uncharacterized membrane protein YtjA (UPF0391 family)